MKESVDGILKLGRAAACLYYGDDEMDSYGHELLHTDYTAIEVLKLPTPQICWQ